MQTYLYQQILKSLRGQEVHKSIDLVLMEGLAEVEILYSKGLLEDTEEKLSKIEEIAKDYQRILFLPLIYEWWFKLQNTRLRYEKVDKQLFEAYEQKYKAIFSIGKEYADWRILMGKVSMLIQGKYTREFHGYIEKMVEELGIYMPNAQRSVPSEIAELQLRAFLASTIRDKKQSGAYRQYLYNFVKELPEPIFSDHKKVYYHAIGNAILNSKDIQQALKLSKTFENIKEKDRKYLTLYTHLYIIGGQLNVYLSLGLLEECRDIIKNFPKEEGCPNKAVSQFIKYQFAVFYYADGAYDKALDMLDDVLLDKGSTKSTSLGSMLKAIVLYEQGEYILLESYLSNIRRNFRKKEILFEFDGYFISLINKLISLPKKEHREVLIGFRTEVKLFLRNTSSLQKEFLLYFNYLGWLDYQIDKKEFKKFCYWTLEDVDQVI